MASLYVTVVFTGAPVIVKASSLLSASAELLVQRNHNTSQNYNSHGTDVLGMVSVLVFYSNFVLRRIFRYSTLIVSIYSDLETRVRVIRSTRIDPPPMTSC